MNAAAAQYIPPNSDCSRAGIYQVNTFNLSQRPKYLYESTTLHEAVPGHHLQLAISNELQNVPQFRKYLDFTAFIEGWALCKFYILKIRFRKFR
jgi:prolyl oligopeptidase